MKFLSLLILTAMIASPLEARTVERTAAPTSDQPSASSVEDMSSRNLNRHSAQKDYEQDAVTSGQSATERNDGRFNMRKRCQTINGEWLRPIDVGYDGCMADSRTLKK